MKTKKQKIILFIAVIMLSAGAFAAWYFIPVKKASNVTVYCYNMQYACGDCYEREWRVTGIKSEGEEQFPYLVNTDIIVRYSDAFERQMREDPQTHCFGCFEFTFTGDLYYSEAEEFVLESTVNSYTIRENCCTEQLEDIQKQLQ